MNDQELLVLCELMMCSDPWPLDEAGTQDVMIDFANRMSEANGYRDWIHVLHEIKRD